MNQHGRETSTHVKVKDVCEEDKGDNEHFSYTSCFSISKMIFFFIAKQYECNIPCEHERPYPMQVVQLLR